MLTVPKSEAQPMEIEKSREESRIEKIKKTN
jgi:hypothetical protein